MCAKWNNMCLVAKSEMFSCVLCLVFLHWWVTALRSFDAMSIILRWCKCVMCLMWLWLAGCCVMWKLCGVVLCGSCIALRCVVLRCVEIVLCCVVMYGSCVVLHCVEIVLRCVVLCCVVLCCVVWKLCCVVLCCVVWNVWNRDYVLWFRLPCRFACFKSLNLWNTAF
jgi:hypothetical protein